MQIFIYNRLALIKPTCHRGPIMTIIMKTNIANSAFHPFWVGKLVIHGLRGWRPINGRLGLRMAVGRKVKVPCAKGLAYVYRLHADSVCDAKWYCSCGLWCCISDGPSPLTLYGKSRQNSILTSAGRGCRTQTMDNGIQRQSITDKQRRISVLVISYYWNGIVWHIYIIREPLDAVMQWLAPFQMDRNIIFTHLVTQQFS